MSDSSDDEVYERDEHHYDNDPDTEDEVLASDDGEDGFNDTDSDDDDDGEEGGDDGFDDNKFGRFKIEKQKEDMASDIEDDDVEAYLPNSQAWGKDKHAYYNTDFVDRDYRSQKGKEEDLAQYEEEEAANIQKRMLEQFTRKKKITFEDIDGQASDEENSDEDVEFNLDSMTAEEKVKLLQQDASELLFLVEKFEQYVGEIKDTLEPLLEGLEKNNAPESVGLRFLRTRYAVLLNYTTNLSFYFAMMSSDDKDIVKNHPIMRQLFHHQTLIEQLDKAFVRNGKRLAREVPYIMEALEDGKSLKFLSPDSITALENEEEDEDAMDLGVAIDDDDEDVFDPLSDGEDEVGAEVEEEAEKRGITYEMEKNKGLIPKRQKVQRNPRVKYRKKFERAVVRRKGQVREPRKEIKKYGGEHTGINTRVVKSVKFK